MAAETDILSGCRVRHRMHLDGADKNGRWFADMHQVVEHPRISRMTKDWRKRGLPTEVTWYLDNELMGTRANALAAYAANPLPPVNDEEMAALKLVGDEFGDFPEGVLRSLLSNLNGKGLIENTPPPEGERRWPIRRTDLGRKVISAGSAS